MPDLNTTDREILRLAEALREAKAAEEAATVDAESIRQELSATISERDDARSALHEAQVVVGQQAAALSASEVERLKLDALATRTAEERDRLRSELRRAQAATLPALLLSLPDLDLAQTDEELDRTEDAILSILDDDPIALVPPARCVQDGAASLPALFLWALQLRDAYREGPRCAFYLREPRAAVPTDPKVAAWERDPVGECPAGSHGTPEVKAAVMCRKSAA